MGRAEPPPTSSTRNVWAAGATSFFADVSGEMVQHLLPLFLANVLGVRVWAVGLVDGLAETTSSVLKLVSGRASDRLGTRKWLAVAGYGVSAGAKPFLLLAGSWQAVAAVRWADRAGKGIRAAPRDALLSESVPATRRGWAFGVHRAADTGGAVVGLLVSLWVVGQAQGGNLLLEAATFHRLVLWSLIPAFAAVVVLALFARDVPGARGPAPGVPDGRGLRAGRTLRALGPGFGAFAVASAVFELGNSSDAFLVLRAQERGAGVQGILWMILAFNVVYTCVAGPAGSLSDRVGRKRLLLGAWCGYALLYVGFAAARSTAQVATLFAAYGAYHGLGAGAARALVADLVPPSLRGTAFGVYHAVVGLMSLPASLLAGLLWQGAGPWHGLGPAAPFAAGAGIAAVATVLLATTVPGTPPVDAPDTAGEN